MADLAWRLLQQGYDAVAADRAARGGADDFETRLLGRRAVVVRSREGARIFYDESVVRRRDAIPPPLGWLLFGRGAVHTLDPPEHRDRKGLLLELVSPERLASLGEEVDTRLRVAVAAWPGSRVHVHDQLVQVYGAAVLRWAGVPLDERDAADRSRQLAEIVDGFGFSGGAYTRAWQARVQSDRWATRLVEEVRAGRVRVPVGSAVAVLAGSDLPARTAGVELLNLLRPTVAVAWLGTFAALRFGQDPSWRARLVDPGGHRERFAYAQEVRRTTPFVPALAARVHQRADLGGLVVQPGDRLVLDVPGIDHDPARWPDPQRFDPARFLSAEPGPFDLVPQGGGSPSAGHRCPGESATMVLLDVTLRVLGLVDYQVTGSGVDRRRIPTLPEGGLVLRVPQVVAGEEDMSAGSTGYR